MSSSAVSVAQAQSTPVKQLATPSSAVQDSPGNWKHPRLAEITRRRNLSTFSEKHIRQIVYNSVALFGILLLREMIPYLVPWLWFFPQLRHYTNWIYWIYAALIVVSLINIAFALLPLVRTQDDLSDIPLTPAQRKLLGLPPSSKPATPNSVYSTPPKYSRTPSMAGSPASIKSYTSSALSNLASPGSGQYSSPRLGTSPSKLNPSPYSPSTVSPLLHKAVGGGINGGRTVSFGSPGSLGASTTSSLFGASTSSSVFGDGPPTPTPATGKRSSVSLNNKWLYEKGRRSSGSGWLHQNFP
ncbi:nuclear pore complex component-domain-containing protein [Achaetomium macrosporum]|uniref:Nuclear pore complex component-domain-containing protein n=1 Tax=Achaetomium macrosporum TaxID=79813 RepID=A0AAN7CAY8_9PEZI|nr:nuclear pore complex component-domain-containing protein [Achaetomium macrosporum]